MGNAKSVSASRKVTPIMENATATVTIQAPFPVSEKKLEKGRYHLKFTFHVYNIHDTTKPLDLDNTYSAVEACMEPEIWYPYIETLMNDAVDELNESGESASLPRLGVHKIRVQMACTSSTDTFKGVVSWNSKVIDKKAVWDSAQWRVGDRMSTYEIQDFDAGWGSSIVLKGLRIATKKA